MHLSKKHSIYCIGQRNSRRRGARVEVAPDYWGKPGIVQSREIRSLLFNDVPVSRHDVRQGTTSSIGIKKLLLIRKVE